MGGPNHSISLEYLPGASQLSLPTFSFVQICNCSEKLGAARFALGASLACRIGVLRERVTSSKRPHHLPVFITAPGDTDILMVVVGIVLIGAVLMVGNLYLRLHSFV
jgi:hypothetical protein